MEVRWKPAPVGVYRSIYNHYKDDLVVFESFTEMDAHGDKLKAQGTSWGFKGAEHPIIRITLQDYNVYQYYLLDTVLDIF